MNTRRQRFGALQDRLPQYKAQCQNCEWYYYHSNMDDLKYAADRHKTSNLHEVEIGEKNTQNKYIKMVENK